MSSYLPILLGIGVSFAISLVAVPYLIRFGHKHDFVDRPGKHKRHREPTPVLGGVALFLALWGSVFATVAVFPSLYGQLADSLFYIFVGALMIFLVGLSDDLSPVSAWTKLAAQVGAGLILYLGGLGVSLVTTPFGSIDIGGFSALITVLWVVGLSNAINLIDGLDGLASGVSLIGAVVLMTIGLLYDMSGELIFMSGLIGFLSLFLYHNKFPAKIFLGDSGSLQLGYYFAVFSLIFRLKSFTASALFVPLLALGVPLLETASSFTRRLLSGRNVMAADRGHLFDYLGMAGLSARWVIIVFYALATIFGLFALAMFFWNRALVLWCLLIFMVVILAIFFIFIIKTSDKQMDDHSA